MRIDHWLPGVLNGYACGHHETVRLSPAFTHVFGDCLNPSTVKLALAELQKMYRCSRLFESPKMRTSSFFRHDRRSRLDFLHRK